MVRYILKVLSALGLALLVYSIGMPGCSKTHFGAARTLNCADFPSSFNCKAKNRPDITTPPPLTPGMEEESTSPPPNGHTKTGGSQPVPPKKHVDLTYNVSLGKVDILFVIDNSSSMAVEHRNLADQFHSFLNNIRDVDYHIAVITTDISSSPENPVRNAYYQDGKFLPIGRRVFLRNEDIGNMPSRTTIEEFRTAISRNETKRCDHNNQPRSSRSNSKYSHVFTDTESSIECPSHDERGTYAVYKAIQNPRHSNFFRPDAHFIIVILSDEDVRSGKEYIDQVGFGKYALESFDYPEVLVESIYNRLGKTKSFSVHSIIIPPGDKRCLDEQNRSRNQGHGSGRGYYGREYARLSERDSELRIYGNLLKGSVISICRRGYGSQLQRVAVSANTIRIPLACGRPASVGLYADGDKIRSSYRIEERTLVMEPGKVKLGSQLKVKVSCEAT